LQDYLLIQPDIALTYGETDTATPAFGQLDGDT
jgi:hypothetical protein